VANGKSAVLKYAVAQEVDSALEKGYMDVIVVLSDRKLGAADARDIERLEAMTRNDGLVALVVRLNTDARIMSAEPLHRRSRPLYRPLPSFGGSPPHMTKSESPGVSGPMGRRTNFASIGATTLHFPRRLRWIQRRGQCRRIRCSIDSPY
jgi:hypothetical protein